MYPAWQIMTWKCPDRETNLCPLVASCPSVSMTFCTCRRVKCLILDLLSEECRGHLSCWQFSWLVSVTLMAQRSESSRWMKPLGNISGSPRKFKFLFRETVSYLTCPLVAPIESYPLPSHLISPSVPLISQLSLVAVDIGSLDESSSVSFQLSVLCLFADCHWKWSASWVNHLWLNLSVSTSCLTSFTLYHVSKDQYV